MNPTTSAFSLCQIPRRPDPFRGGADVESRSARRRPCSPGGTATAIATPTRWNCCTVHGLGRPCARHLPWRAQLINVALGGAGGKDIATQIPGASVLLLTTTTATARHRLERGFVARPPLTRNGAVAAISIHHQAIKALGRGLGQGARCRRRVIRRSFEGRNYVFGVQWHRGSHPPGAPHLLDCAPILDDSSPPHAAADGDATSARPSNGRRWKHDHLRPG